MDYVIGSSLLLVCAYMLYRALSDYEVWSDKYHSGNPKELPLPEVAKPVTPSPAPVAKVYTFIPLEIFGKEDK